MNMLYNDFKGTKFWLRYFLQKYSPEFMRPFLLNCFYFQYFKKKINLKNPILFSEKLNILKIHNITKEKINLTDKLFAKKYINENFPDLKTAKLYGEYDTFDDINFYNLPKTFIIKTNHACKTAMLVKDKNKIDYLLLRKYKKYFEKVLKINYAFWGTLELQYKDIKPKIFVEEYLHTKDNTPFNEYEVYCINGIPKLIECHNFNGIPSEDLIFGVSFYNPDWTKSEISIFYKRGTECKAKEKNKEKIIKYAKLLSKDFEFARVDFFEIDEELYFGEITFSPFSGNIKFVPQEIDYIWGKELNINKKR